MGGRAPARWLVLVPVIVAAAVGLIGREQGWWSAAPEPRSIAPGRHNVLLISVDTLRPDRLGAYGCGQGTSPVLDRLARESVVFSDVLAQAPTTAPSHRSIFTGRYVYEHRNGAAGLRQMPQIFRDAGYETAAFVDGGQLSRDFRLDLGFDLYHESPADSSDQLGGGLTDLAPKVVAWLRQERDRPFFLFVHTYDVHCPYLPPFPHREQFTRELDYPAGLRLEGKCGRAELRHLDLGPADFRYISALYDGGVRFADSKLAAILEECRGLEDPTIVVVTSDHGESLGEQEWVGHNQVLDVQLKVPLLVMVPGVEPRCVDYPAQGIDILPTLSALVGLETDAEWSGEDLSSRLLGERATNRRFRLAETRTAGQRTVRLGPRWALRMKRGEPVALHDLFTDPEEVRDVSGEEPQIARQLEDEYRKRGIPAGLVREVPGTVSEETRRQLEALGYVGN